MNASSCSAPQKRNHQNHRAKQSYFQDEIRHCPLRSATTRHVCTLLAFANSRSLTNSYSAIPLNPQPLPPGIKFSLDPHGGIVRREAEALNPQQLPPGIRFSNEVHDLPPDPAVAGGVVRREALNPQPLPPGVKVSDGHPPPIRRNA